MENSTKALIIAGTALIVILLISVGMNFFNSSSELSYQVDDATKTTASSNFNAQFLSYVGGSVSPTRVRELIKKVMINNVQASSSNTFSPESHQIYLNIYRKNTDHIIPGGGHHWKVSALQNLYDCILDTQTYTVRVTKGCKMNGAVQGFYKGYVLCMSIQENY